MLLENKTNYYARALSGGKPLSQIAKEVHINLRTLQKWYHSRPAVFEAICKGVKK